MCPYGSLKVLMLSYGSLNVLIGPYKTRWYLLILMRHYGF